MIVKNCDWTICNRRSRTGDGVTSLRARSAGFADYLSKYGTVEKYYRTVDVIGQYRYSEVFHASSA